MIWRIGRKYLSSVDAGLFYWSVSSYSETIMMTNGAVAFVKVPNFVYIKKITPMQLTYASIDMNASVNRIARNKETIIIVKLITSY